MKQLQKVMSISDIRGGSQASMMSLQNPEAFGQIVSIAPAEGQKKNTILIDSSFEAMVNPDKFCFWQWYIEHWKV